MVLRSLQRGLDRILLRMVGTKARAQQALNALAVSLHRNGFAGDDAPSNTPSRDKIILRHTAESHARHVRRNSGESDVRRAVENQLVIDLVGEDDQVVT